MFITSAVQKDGLRTMAVRLNYEVGVKCAIKLIKENEENEEWELYANDNSWNMTIKLYQNKQSWVSMHETPVMALFYVSQALHAYDISRSISGH